MSAGYEDARPYSSAGLKTLVLTRQTDSMSGGYVRHSKRGFLRCLPRRQWSASAGVHTSDWLTAAALRCRRTEAAAPGSQVGHFGRGKVAEKVESAAGSMLHNRAACKTEVLLAAHSAGSLSAVQGSLLQGSAPQHESTSGAGLGARTPGSAVQAAPASCNAELELLYALGGHHAGSCLTHLEVQRETPPLLNKVQVGHTLRAEGHQSGDPVLQCAQASSVRRSSWAAVLLSILSALEQGATLFP